ncbi:hypothetical protein NpNSSI1_00005055 [Neofusicoccum parvum]|nr:hypothetical protein NpNSSI1_00005055 [Neofusicoccum parvum]
MPSFDISFILDLAYDFRGFVYDSLPHLTSTIARLATLISSLNLPTAYFHALPTLITASLTTQRLTPSLPFYLLLALVTNPLSLYCTYYFTPATSLLRTLVSLSITLPTDLLTIASSLLTTASSLLSRLCSLTTELQILLLWTALIASVLWENAAAGASGWDQLADHAHLTGLLVVEGFWATRWGVVSGQGEVLKRLCGKWVRWLDGEGERDGWEEVRLG